MKTEYAVLNWRKKDSTHPRTGYYCSNCAGHIGKQGKGQLLCPYCKARIVGKYA